MTHAPSHSVQPLLVSVMMPAYNSEAYIGLAIDSLLAQTYPHWELVVIDDGSTDGTAAQAARFADPRIRLFHQPNGGEAAARNYALAELQGDLVAFLDADDLFLPDHLEAAAACLQAHPEWGGVFTDGYHIDAAGQRSDRLSAYRRPPREGWVFDQVVRASDFFGPPVCMVLRRQPIVEHGLSYDLTIGLGTDWDFIIRFTETESFGYIDQPTCLYRVHTTNLTTETRLEDRRRGRRLCRERAIKLPGFTACSVATRSYAFYDLLVNLLTGQPERQNEITRWPEFGALPAGEQARLLRLMASRAIAEAVPSASVGEWLRRARALDPGDRRGALVAGLYQLSPALCRLVLRAKMRRQTAAQPSTAFGRLD